MEMVSIRHRRLAARLGAVAPARSFAAPEPQLALAVR